MVYVRTINDLESCQLKTHDWHYFTPYNTHNKIIIIFDLRGKLWITQLLILKKTNKNVHCKVNDRHFERKSFRALKYSNSPFSTFSKGKIFLFLPKPKQRKLHILQLNYTAFT